MAPNMLIALRNDERQNSHLDDQESRFLCMNTNSVTASPQVMNLQDASLFRNY